jgi:hypothetical protein
VNGPSLSEVVAVVRDYVTAVRLPLPTLARPSKRAAAFAGLVISGLALLSIEALGPVGLGRAALLVPFLGLVAGGIAAWRATPDADPALWSVRETALRVELDSLADSRVALVIRQFEWAVNDVERLRQAVRRVEVAKLAADKRATELELRNRQFRSMVEQAQTQLAEFRAEPLRVPRAAPVVEMDATLEMHWSLHDDGATQRLRLETDHAGASRIRLLDPDGHLLTISDPAEPASPRSDGPLGFILEMSVPPDVIAELDAGRLRHRFEALVAETWHPVTLSDSGIRGRFYIAEGIRSIA